MENNNLPTVYKNTLPAKIKRAVTKTGKIIGNSALLLGSSAVLGVSATLFPPLLIPAGALALYAGNKLANNIYYTDFKDLAFVGRKHGNNVKIYQDVVRPDIFSELRGMDKREKIAFLQLQALVGLTKFDRLGKNGKPMTIETDSHGIIRKTFQKLSEQGYLENYQENFLKKSHLILPKLAFGNTDLKSQAEMYNMKFQKSEKAIDFDDPEFKKLFPMVFTKRGLLSRKGYTIEKGENGQLSINYNKKQRREAKREERRTKKQEKLLPETTELTQEEVTLEKQSQKFRQELEYGLSLEEQKKYVQTVLENEIKEGNTQIQDIDKGIKQAGEELGK